MSLYMYLFAIYFSIKNIIINNICKIFVFSIKFDFIFLLYNIIMFAVRRPLLIKSVFSSFQSISQRLWVQKRSNSSGVKISEHLNSDLFSKKN